MDNNIQERYLLELICLSNYIINDLPRNIRQPERPALKWKSEFCMIKAQLVQDRSLYIENGRLAADGRITDLVGLAVAAALFNSPTRHPDGKRLHMMVPSLKGVLLAIPVLHHRRPSELASPRPQGSRPAIHAV